MIAAWTDVTMTVRNDTIYNVMYRKSNSLLLFIAPSRRIEDTNWNIFNTFRIHFVVLRMVWAQFEDYPYLDNVIISTI